MMGSGYFSDFHTWFYRTQYLGVGKEVKENELTGRKEKIPTFIYLIYRGST